MSQLKIGFANTALIMAIIPAIWFECVAIPHKLSNSKADLTRLPLQDYKVLILSDAFLLSEVE